MPWKDRRNGPSGQSLLVVGKENLGSKVDNTNDADQKEDDQRRYLFPKHVVQENVSVLLQGGAKLVLVRRLLLHLSEHFAPPPLPQIVVRSGIIVVDDGASSRSYNIILALVHLFVGPRYRQQRNRLRFVSSFMYSQKPLTAFELILCHPPFLHEMCLIVDPRLSLPDRIVPFRSVTMFVHCSAS
jgi:hypothetical protein